MILNSEIIIKHVKVSCLTVSNDGYGFIETFLDIVGHNRIDKTNVRFESGLLPNEANRVSSSSYDIDRHRSCKN